MEEGGCGALRQDQGTAVRDMSPGAVVEPTLLCVRLSGPCCHASQLRSDLTRPRPASFSLTACSGGKHARPPSPAGTTSLPGRAQVSPGPFAEPSAGEWRLCGSPGRGRGRATDVAGHTAPETCLWALRLGPGDNWVLQGSPTRKG